ncbi:MAG: hypothetical protein Q7J32_09055 [Sphingomonadaceae bacterium]|nr:hypothetical protein [Sphingomonadaceae bacterium]
MAHAETKRFGDRLAAGLAAAIGLLGVGNGLAMLTMPQTWFWSVDGVSLTGGYNAHFVRDIGLVYLLAGAAMFAGLARPTHRSLLWGAAAGWLSMHALFHLWEVAAGICGPDAIARDFLGVTLPGLAATGLALRSWRRDGRPAG